jgi:hypothetical protein
VTYSLLRSHPRELECLQDFLLPQSWSSVSLLDTSTGNAMSGAPSVLEREVEVGSDVNCFSSTQQEVVIQRTEIFYSYTFMKNFKYT